MNDDGMITLVVCCYSGMCVDCSVERLPVVDGYQTSCDLNSRKDTTVVIAFVELYVCPYTRTRLNAEKYVRDLIPLPHASVPCVADV